MAACSAPVVHLFSITWHPPSFTFRNRLYIIFTFVLDKLFTVLWDLSERCQLRGADSSISYIFPVTSWEFTSICISDVSSTLTVVTDDSHANSTLITHVTVHTEGCHASFAIRVNDVITWRGTRLLCFYSAAAGLGPGLKNFDDWCCLDRPLKIFSFTWVTPSLVWRNFREQQSSIWIQNMILRKYITRLFPKYI